MAEYAARRIALFVEGETERGATRHGTLAPFIHRWLDPQLPQGSRVGILTRKFHGVSNYIDDLGQQVELHLDNDRASFVVGLVDLYGLPPSQIDLRSYFSVKEKVSAARAYLRSRVPKRLHPYFRQHFAVHEIEAWLLADPPLWPTSIRSQIQKRPPEQINFHEPPAKFLKRLLAGSYKKVTTARDLFPKLDPQIAIEKCPYLKCFLHDFLLLAQKLAE